MNVYLAPMEDVTDPAFRLLCKRFGADRVYTEFVNADALVRDVASTTRKLQISDAERPVSIQIYGKDPDSMAEAARIVEQAKPDFIDINFGCPVKKVAGKGAGAGLLREPDKMLAITRAVVNAVHLPVTVKTRLGWDEPSLYLPDGTPFIVDMAERLQDCGIAELAIHGRTRSQMYRGEADWTLIGEVKNNPRIHIPIIGNGDITTPERARECFDKYGVDAIMIGRASFGCPWIFAEIKEALTAQPVLQQRDLTAPAVLQAQPVLQQRGPTAPAVLQAQPVLQQRGLTAPAVLQAQPVLQQRGLTAPAVLQAQPVLQQRDLTAALPRSMATKVAILKEYVDASIAWIGDERKGIVHSRRHFAASPVFKGLFDFKQTRIALLRADTRAEVFSIMDEIVDRYSHSLG